MNTNFLKQLTLLFVEDDKTIIKILETPLTNIFKKVYLVEDGQAALDLFLEKRNEIDVIISDIELPSLNGIEILRKVRDVDYKLPFFLMTGYSDVNYLLEAIKLNSTEYILKPADFKVLISKIHDACEDRHSEKIIHNQKKQLEQYLDVINRVAIISKTDLSGNITFTNDIFCDVAGYTKEELLGKTHNIIRHPDMPSSVFKVLWETIKAGKTWSGKVKNRAKDGSAYYVNATIIPVFDDINNEIIEYVGIRFLTTQDELEKREFKRKVINSIKQTKEEQFHANKHIKTLENELKKFDNVDILQNSFAKEQDRTKKMKVQLNHYENEIVEIRTKNSKLITETNQKVGKAVEFARLLKTSNEKMEKETTLLKDEIEHKSRVLKDLQGQVKEQQKTIENLRDVIKHREEQLSGFKR